MNTKADYLQKQSQMRVLALGDTSGMELPQGAVVEYARGEGQYDLIMLINVVQRAPRGEVVGFLQSFVEQLAEGGELLVVTPSLEWAAQAIVRKDEPGLGPYLAIYGADGEPNKSGFTMLWLRAAVEGAGFTARKAVQQQVQYNGRAALENWVYAMRTA